MPKILSRRDFLKLGALALGSLAFDPFREMLPKEDRVELTPIKIVRVAIRKDEIRTSPSLTSRVVGYRTRDELVRVYEELISPDGPPHNPRWYRVIGGYMHTAHLPPVETHYQRPVETIREGGQVFEVSVPWTPTFQYSSELGWQPLYRLYYKSNHWVTGIAEGPDGFPWYIITDDLIKVQYFARATHLRLITGEEFAPITPEIANKRIAVSLARQTLDCFENEALVLHTNVSTGIPSLGATTNGVPTETPRGTFNVSMKTPVRHMGDAQLTSDIFAYELPGVPWCTFFTETGVAFHGTYWHDNFGGRMSHGCVNMRPEEAHWLFRWTTPVYPWTTPVYPNEPGKWHVNGYGTKVVIN